MPAPLKTPAHQVARVAHGREAGGMLRNSARSLSRLLRLCPVCQSRAVREIVAEEIDDDVVQLSLQCGECGTWRAEALPAHRADAVERRLERLLGRDRRDIEDELRRVEVGGIDSEDLREVANTRPAYF